MRNNLKPFAEDPDFSNDEKSAYMANMTLALYESMGIEPPANPTVETVRAFLSLLEESYDINVTNN